MQRHTGNELVEYNKAIRYLKATGIPALLHNMFRLRRPGAEFDVWRYPPSHGHGSARRAWDGQNVCAPGTLNAAGRRFIPP